MDPRTLGRVALALCVTASAAPRSIAAPAAAQTTQAAVEVGASSVSPPSGVAGSDARYVVAGASLRHRRPAGSGVALSLLTGRSTDGAAGGSYLSGSVDAALRRRLGGGLYLGFDARGFAFDVEEPYGFRSWGLEGGPTLEYRGTHVSGRLRGTTGMGGSRTQILVENQATVTRRHMRTEPTAVLETVRDSLWRYGVDAEVLLGSGPAAGGVAAGVHRSPEGAYRFAGVRALYGGGGSAVEVRLDRWETPFGSRTSGGVAFVISMDAWGVRGFLGRSAPDPLTRTDPGKGAAGALVSRRVYASGGAAAGAATLYDAEEAGDDGTWVQVRVEVPGQPGRVELIADFTLWEPVPLEQDGATWHLRVRVPAGVHHFGFLVDGAWYVPEDAPDTAVDEWGRRTATMVIEP